MTVVELLEDRCPACEGQGVALGTLGYMLHLRCRDCGADFAVDSPDSYEED
jgi:tRNA(Ile2) C34 agmatinyltransferase TiaS